MRFASPLVLVLVCACSHFGARGELSPLSWGSILVERVADTSTSKSDSALLAIVLVGEGGQVITHGAVWARRLHFTGQRESVPHPPINRFDIGPVPVGRYEVFVRAIGYRPYSFLIDALQPGAVRIRVIMQEYRIEVREVLPGPPEG